MNNWKSRLIYWSMRTGFILTGLVYLLLSIAAHLNLGSCEGNSCHKETHNAVDALPSQPGTLHPKATRDRHVSISSNSRHQKNNHHHEEPIMPNESISLSEYRKKHSRDKSQTLELDNLDSEHVNKSGEPKTLGDSLINQDLAIPVQFQGQKSDEIMVFENNSLNLVKSVKDSHQAKRILIAATYRSGSSFFGKLFDLHPESFYWFEPLAGLYFDFFKRYNLQKHPVFNGFEYEGRVMDNYSLALHEQALKSVLNIFSCNASSLPPNILLQYFIVRNTVSHKIRITFSRCLKKDGIKNAEKNLRVCLPTLSYNCLRSKVRVIKTIRLSLKLVRELMESDPELNVIHLVRDPRGTIQSRHNALDYGRVDLLRDSNVLCSSMRQDILLYETLHKTFPGRILQMKFEDLALNPIQNAKKVYRFAGMSFPEDMKAWLVNHTTSAFENSIMGVRRNATLVVNKWRTKLDEFAKIGLNETCGDIIKHYGYPLD